MWYRASPAHLRCRTSTRHARRAASISRRPRRTFPAPLRPSAPARRPQLRAPPASDARRDPKPRRRERRPRASAERLLLTGTRRCQSHAQPRSRPMGCRLLPPPRAAAAAAAERLLLPHPSAEPGGPALTVEAGGRRQGLLPFLAVVVVVVQGWRRLN